jgi:hypothetical protein
MDLYILLYLIVKQEHIFKLNFPSPKGVGASFFNHATSFFHVFPCDDHWGITEKKREKNSADVLCGGNASEWGVTLIISAWRRSGK